MPIIEAALTSVATRVNYGLDSSTTGGKVPAAFCIWRWEVKPEYRDWLPKAIKDKAEGRILERKQV
jgi:chromatin assembly factor 1 subunit A